MGLLSNCFESFWFVKTFIQPFIMLIYYSIDNADELILHRHRQFEHIDSTSNVNANTLINSKIKLTHISLYIIHSDNSFSMLPISDFDQFQMHEGHQVEEALTLQLKLITILADG